MIRQPIVTLVGHIDHGKSSILDAIKGTSIVAKEAGGITQCISSTCVPIATIEAISGELLKKLNLNLTIPGLLFLDTPGHAAFNNLRKRGGNLADIAILVIDINEGLMEQTLECIEILKQYKTPFVIALNKLDLLSGWQPHPELPLLEALSKQSEPIQRKVDNQLYEILGKLSELEINSERFDRVNDFTKQVAMVPLSSKTKEGIPELLMVITGLAQKFLENNLKIDTNSPGKATILEVKEETGLGTTIDVILYDGKLKQNDTIVIGAINNPFTTKIRTILMPEEKTATYTPIKEIHAAAGVKISAPELKEVVSGMPLLVANKDLEKAKKEVQKEVESVLIETDKEGIIIKADSLGSLEALIGLLKEKKVSIKRASIGPITKKDIAEAKAELNPLNRVILGFNVKTEEDKSIKIITHEVIYRIIDDLEAWQKKEQERQEKKQLEGLVKPCKIQIMQGCIFRQSNPAVVGVEVMEGTLKTTTPLMKEDGSKLVEVKSMQSENENVDTAEKGKEVAISLPGITVERQINESDILYSDIPEDDFIRFKKMKSFLKGNEIQLLKEIANIKRKTKPLWGI